MTQTQTAVSTATSFSELLEELKTEALNFWQNAESNAVQIFNTGVKDIEPVVEAEVVVVMGQLKSLAVGVVGALGNAALSSLTSGQKLSTAASAIVQAAEAQGKTLALADATNLAQGAFNAIATAKPAS